MSAKYNLITVLGHTAGGKTSFAVALADKLNTEIISADSRQVYKGMDIGTGKDINEYYANNKKINYHLIDIVKAGEQYNVYEFKNDFLEVYTKLREKGLLPIMCGGTGMYLEAVLNNYNLIHVPVNKQLRENLENKSMAELSEILKSLKKLHNRSDLDTPKRAIRAIEIAEYFQNNPQTYPDFPQINSLNIGIKYDREVRRERITQRLKERLNSGMIEEAQNLINNFNVKYEQLEYYGLEYKYLAWYLSGKISYDEMFEQLNTAIHQFAKRQMTWFRRMEKKGHKIFWIDTSKPLSTNLEMVIRRVEL